MLNTSPALIRLFLIFHGRGCQTLLSQDISSYMKSLETPPQVIHGNTTPFISYEFLDRGTSFTWVPHDESIHASCIV